MDSQLYRLPLRQPGQFFQLSPTCVSRGGQRLVPLSTQRRHRKLGTAILTSSDFSGSLAFNSGSLGLTTIAVTGYDTGSLYSKAQSLQAVEENESDIAKYDRYFEPMSLTVTLNDVVDKNGKAIDLYLDFSDLDDSIKKSIVNLDALSSIGIEYEEGPLAKMLFDVSELMGNTTVTNVASINVDADKLYAGMQSTESGMKGLFIKTSAKIDTDSGGASTA